MDHRPQRRLGSRYRTTVLGAFPSAAMVGSVLGVVAGNIKGSKQQ